MTAREGSILDRSSIAEDGFVYEALLVELPCVAVREMLAGPADINGLATLEGVQFILPQTIGQAIPDGRDAAGDDRAVEGAFDPNAPIRAALLDGTPVAAHRSLEGGVVIEDMHDLVRLSPVVQRYHATAMASLILRGDLQADGTPLTDTRLISVPVLIDQEDGAETARNRLFVDVVHTTLMRLIGTDEPAAPDVFVVNFSIGVRDSHFSGRISALARLMDWWAAKEGLLFVISAGNVGHLALPGTTLMDFENAAIAARRATVRRAMRDGIFNRTLLAPAESLNGLTVGALSLDHVNHVPPQDASILKLEEDDEFVPQMTSALGLTGLPPVYKARSPRSGRLPGSARHAARDGCQVAGLAAIKPYRIDRCLTARGGCDAKIPRDEPCGCLGDPFAIARRRSAHRRRRAL